MLLEWRSRREASNHLWNGGSVAEIGFKIINDIVERGVESVKVETFEIDEEFIHTYIHTYIIKKNYAFRFAQAARRFHQTHTTDEWIQRKTHPYSTYQKNMTRIARVVKSAHICNAVTS